MSRLINFHCSSVCLKNYGQWSVIWYCCCCCLVASVISDSMRPQRRQPTRLPRPWDSPDKNTGVGCHFLLQCRKVKSKSESEVAQSCPTLGDPMDCSSPGSSVHGILQARMLEWGTIAFSDNIVQEAANKSSQRKRKTRRPSGNLRRLYK